MKEPRPTLSESMRTHRRQFTWQILFPFVLMTAVIIIATLLFIPWGTSASTTWRDISIMWLLIPMIILAVFVFIILVMLIYGFSRVTPLIPRYTGEAQKFTATVAQGTQKVADGIVKPFFWVRGISEKIKTYFKRK